jgi:hypothetical protein
MMHPKDKAVRRYLNKRGVSKFVIWRGTCYWTTQKRTTSLSKRIRKDLNQYFNLDSICAETIGEYREWKMSIRQEGKGWFWNT